jgi:hypothetical protein
LPTETIPAGVSLLNKNASGRSSRGSDPRRALHAFIYRGRVAFACETSLGRPVRRVSVFDRLSLSFTISAHTGCKNHPRAKPFARGAGNVTLIWRMSTKILAKFFCACRLLLRNRSIHATGIAAVTPRIAQSGKTRSSRKYYFERCSL